MELIDWIELAKWAIGLIIVGPIAWLVFKLRRMDNSSKKSHDAHKDAINAQSTQLALLNQQIKTHEKHVDGQFSAIRDNHAKELSQFYQVVERVEKRLESMEHKVEVGFKEVGDRIFQFLRETNDK